MAKSITISCKNESLRVQMQWCKTFLTTRQWCRMWINGWHDYCLNHIRQRNFTDVSQPENAKNCCVAPKVELQSLVSLPHSSGSQLLGSFWIQNCLAVGFDGMRRIHGFHHHCYYLFEFLFWSYIKDKCTGVTHQHGQHWDTRYIGVCGGRNEK